MARAICLNDLCRRYCVPVAVIAPQLRDLAVPFEQRGRRYWFSAAHQPKLVAAIRQERARRRGEAMSRDPGRPADKVYFIRCGEYLKIGFGLDTRRRFTALKVGCPYEMKIVAEIPGGAELEAALHRRFGRHHHRGEWFHFDGDLAAYVRSLGDKNLRQKYRDAIFGIDVFRNQPSP